MGSMNWSRASAGLKPHVPLEVTAAEMLREILTLQVEVSPARGGGAAAEPRAGDLVLELLFCALLVSLTVHLQRFICVHLYWSAALCEAKCVCLMQDTATTAKQSV